MDKICRKCRWWKAREHGLRHGGCERITSGGGHRSTARIYPAAGGAFLFTPEDFGCVEFEGHPKEIEIETAFREGRHRADKDREEASVSPDILDIQINQ